jgi:hypothetical protein
MGVNKYNLNTYAKTYQFIYNNRRLDIFSKFIKILSSVLLVLIIATTFYSMSDYIYANQYVIEHHTYLRYMPYIFTTQQEA